jgi:hypothetical protein
VDGAEGSRVEGMRRFSAVRLPRRRELALTVTNKDDEDEDVGGEPEGIGRASRNPVRMRDRLA